MAARRMPMALRERLGEEATDDFVEVIESTRTEWNEHVLTLAEARFERRLAEQIASFRVEVAREVGQLHRGLAAIREDVTRELAAMRVELIRWSFLFWIGQVAVMIAVLTFMLRDAAP